MGVLERLVDQKSRKAFVKLHLFYIGELAKKMLSLIGRGLTWVNCLRWMRDGE